MWVEEFGKKIARILALMANRPNSKQHSQYSGVELFDGGERTVMTGITTYKFSDGSEAIYGSSADFNLSIKLATGEKVSIVVSPRKCERCGNVIWLGETSCMRCGQ